ncbi:MAG: hypothetical protein QG596_1033 [Actinomycetota bacterium]|nr:hypothetical protein [Actinomycetota bacterium]
MSQSTPLGGGLDGPAGRKAKGPDREVRPLTLSPQNRTTR